MKNREWISTGEAARKIGYSRRNFSRKFIGIIQSKRYGEGNYRWLASEVDALMKDTEVQTAA